MNVVLQRLLKDVEARTGNLPPEVTGLLDYIRNLGFRESNPAFKYANFIFDLGWRAYVSETNSSILYVAWNRDGRLNGTGNCVAFVSKSYYELETCMKRFLGEQDMNQERYGHHAMKYLCSLTDELGDEMPVLWRRQGTFSKFDTAIFL